MIRRTEAGLYQARCDGALNCDEQSPPTSRKQAGKSAERKGWSVRPGLHRDGTAANMGVTICPTCVDGMMLRTLAGIDTGSDDAKPKTCARTGPTGPTMADLIRRIKETIRARQGVHGALRK